MKPGAPNRPFDPVARLGKICLALGAPIVLYWLIWGRARALPGPVAPDPEMFAAHAIARPEPDPDIIAAITARPLFLPERQAQDQAASGDAATFVDAGSLSDARLVGIASESGGGVAIVSRGGAQFRVRQGEAVDGWTLEYIRGNIAHFTRGDETRDLQLQYWPNQAPPAPGTAPPGTAKPGAPHPPPPVPTPWTIQPPAMPAARP